MNKYEQLIEFIINEEEDKARALFHEIVVAKSRDIYESLIDEQDLEEVGGNQVDSLVDEITADETGGVVEGDDEFGGEEEFGGEAELGGDESEFDFDQNGELDAHEQEHGSEEERIADLEDALEDLRAEFDKLMGHEAGSHEGDEAEVGSEEGGEGEEEPAFGESIEQVEEAVGSGSGSGSGSGAKSGSGKGSGSGAKSGSGAAMTESDLMREYVETVGKIYGGKGDVNEGDTVGTGADKPTVNKSSVVAGKNDMGGSTANIAKGGTNAVPDGTSANKSPNAYMKGQGEIKSGNRNVPGGKAGTQEKTGKSWEKAKGAEGQTTDGKVAVSATSPLRK